MAAYTAYLFVDSDIYDLAEKSILSSSLVGFDTETNSRGEVKFIQIYVPETEVSYIFDMESGSGKKFISNISKLHIVGHNLPFDISAIYTQFGVYPIPVYDTFLLACSLQEGEKGLKPLVKDYFGFEIQDWESLFQSDPDYLEMSSEKIAYIANDPYFTWKLLDHWKKTGAYDFVKNAHEIDMGCMLHYVLASARGIIVDLDKFDKMIEEYRAQSESLQKKLDTYAGWNVRTSSVRDLRELLFNQMGLNPPPMTTPSGEISVSKEALSYVEDRDGIISLISEIKESKHILASLLKQVGNS